MKIIFSLLLAFAIGITACKHKCDTVPPKEDNTQEGIVSGRVVDSQGKGVSGAEIIASNTDHHNKTTIGYTDASGNYRLKLPTYIAEGSYTVSGTVTLKYHGQNFKMALYEEDTRVFSPYEGAVRNFQFRLTGKRRVDDDSNSSPLGGRIEVHHQVDNVVWENLEITLEPVGPLVDGNTGKKLVLIMPRNNYVLNDIPVGQYKISARDRVTGQKLGVTIKDTFTDYASSVTTLFKEKDFVGDTFWEIILLVNSLKI
ncbi:hypothetical protein GCM10028807_51980 [Spirosoma daeguense]